MYLDRLLYYKRDTVLLAVALVLAAGFFAFLPLYSGAIGEAYVRDSLARESQNDFRVMLRDTVPIDPQTTDLLSARLGHFLHAVYRTQRTLQGPPDSFPTAGFLCGDRLNCYGIFAYDRLTDYFTLAAGTFPAATQAGEPPQAVITVQVAEKSGTHVGDEIRIFSDKGQLTLDVVGLVEPVEDSGVFAVGQNMVTEGAYTQVGDNLRYDFGLAVLPEVYAAQVAPSPVLPNGTLYSWQAELDMGALHAAGLADQRAALRRFEQDLSQLQATIEVTDNASPILSALQRSIDDATRLILLLVVALEALLLVMIFTLGWPLYPDDLIWHDRGAASRQFAWLHARTLSPVMLLGVVIGVPVGGGLLWVVRQTGVLSAALSTAQTNLAPGPVVLFGLAAALAGLGAAVAGFQVRCWLTYEQPPALTPSAPFVVRFYLDALFLLVGGGLLLRFHLLATDDLRDPFNVFAPLIMIVGGAILSARIVLGVIHLRQRLTGRHGVIPPEVRSYASWGLLLVITLALGSGAYTLTATQDAAARASAYQETGGDVRFASDHFPPLPGVKDAIQLAIIPEAYTSRPITLIGVDAAQMAELFPDQAASLKTLAGASNFTPSGLLLPDGAAALTVRIFTVSDGLVLFADLQDSFGRMDTVPLSVTDAAPIRGFAEYRADLPAASSSRFLTGIRIRGRYDANPQDRFTLLLDDVIALSADGQPTVLEDFESSDISRWIVPSSIRQDMVTIRVRDAEQAASGEGSLRVNFSLPTRFAEPVIYINYQPLKPVAVIVSETLSRDLSGSSRGGLDVGDTGEMVLTLPNGHYDLSYEVVGVARTFPTQRAGDYFFVALVDSLVNHLNYHAEPGATYTLNRVLARLADPKPSAALRAALANASPVFAWDAYRAYRYRPFQNHVAGTFAVGFWIALGLWGVVVLAGRGLRERLREFLAWPLVLSLIVGVGSGLLLAYLYLPYLDVSYPLVLPFSPFGAGLVLVLAAAAGVVSRRWL
jgi:hypothetical protein